MIIKTIVDEDFVNYKVPSMYIGTAFCDGKCCREAGIPLSVCQNDAWRSSATIAMDDDIIIQRYLSNDITKALCFAGLEPFEQFGELLDLVTKLRTEYHCNDTVVIYTGYNLTEIDQYIFANILNDYKRCVDISDFRYRIQ